jgi:hypothetical protein
MTSALPLGSALLRGALVTVVNWPVVVAEFVIESLYKLALAVPMVGGGVMVAVLLGTDLKSVFSDGVLAAADLVFSSLGGAPAALIGFAAALGLVAFGGEVVLFVLKGGTLHVLVAGERVAGEIQDDPWQVGRLRQAYAWTSASLLHGVRHYGHRSMLMAVGLGVAYGLVGGTYVVAITWGYRAIEQSSWTSAWPLLVFLATSVAVVTLTAVNVAYDVLRIIVITDDCRIGQAFGRLRRFLIEDARQVIGIFAAFGLVLTLATAVSIFATAGLTLLAWVPLAGVFALPLQAAAWILRGLVFQAMALAALIAYETQYRRFALRAAFTGATGKAGQP